MLMTAAALNDLHEDSSVGILPPDIPMIRNTVHIPAKLNALVNDCKYYPGCLLLHTITKSTRAD